MKVISLIGLMLLQVILTRAQPRDTIRVLFPLDKNNLTEQASKTLDSLIAVNILDREKKLVLLGYGDYLGSATYNNDLSYTRAKNIRDYLIFAGFRKENMTLVVGKGKILRPSNGNGYPTDRKVEIIFNKKLDTPAKQRLYYYLERLQVNEALILRNIHFFRGSIRVTPESLPELSHLWEFMVDHPTWRVRLEGHICCLGPIHGKDEPFDESTLSQKRAEVVRDSLVAHGVTKDRLECVGHGNNFMLNDEETAEQQAINRRVEVRILSR